MTRSTRGSPTAAKRARARALGPAGILRGRRGGDGADARRRPSASPAYMRAAFAQSSDSDSS
jgi:hypothetical protein